ncbi:MAG: geranylgeranylglycerol-phosphate geranylgeranyltransferase [Bacteroidota bacterium]
MIHFLKLIRFQNLFLIALTQYAIRYGIIYPFVKASNFFELQISHGQFALIVLSTVLVAAAGYIINDYFDNKIDFINKPQDVIVGKHIKRRVAMAWHVVFNVLGVSLGFYMGYKVGVYKLGVIHLLTTGLLWYYSSDFKRRILVGNIVVSILAALVPMLVILYEMPTLVAKYRDVLIDLNYNFNAMLYIVAGFSVFAFLITLIREIIKDMEDVIGDKEFGRQTLPVVKGIAFTKWVTVSIIVITLSILLPIQQMQWEANDKASFFYVLFAVDLPLLILLFFVFKSSVKKDFSRASKMAKLIMFLGIAYTAVFAYLLLKPANEPEPAPNVQIQINGGY